MMRCLKCPPTKAGGTGPAAAAETEEGTARQGSSLSPNSGENIRIIIKRINSTRNTKYSVTIHDIYNSTWG